MKEYEVITKFKFRSITEIIEDLTKSKYKDCFFRIKTGIPEIPKYIRPSDNFENELVKKGIKYFAYIKFFVDNEDNQIYGIVAGKTGSSLVNRQTDVCFSTNREDGFSRKFLDDLKLKWYKEEILIITPENNIDNEISKKQALEIERYLKVEFKLLGS